MWIGEFTLLIVCQARPKSVPLPSCVPYIFSRCNFFMYPFRSIKSDIFSSLNAHYGHMSGGGRADDVDTDDDEDEIEAQGDAAEAKGGESASAGAKGSSRSEAKAGGQAK